MSRRTVSHTGNMPVASIPDLLQVSESFHVEEDNELTAKLIVTLNPVKLVNRYERVNARQDAVNAMAVKLIETLEEHGVLGMRSVAHLSLEHLDPDTRDPLREDGQPIWYIDVTIPTDDIANAQAFAAQYNQHLAEIRKSGQMMQ